ncbi:ACT domain-containing protein [Mycolicibacterium smegmatis]|uniref:amino acid-binding protein n=1 Tax=Mycolicibacterium smegmatis TaxID=1772 RepID=UPI000325F287|nr:amino acid-binding protein [Mycolicibacterium smegmatis]MBE9618523.1 amino acid-binding protein [Mycolicibacterium smegmatis]MBE9625057.1 amino acid-binding protein [Mycolicibacterium smegmatis]MBE9629096.1 amino acid-binding protein [Mycolicibacterium smegmatis]MBE9643566.1 amino acid-binding protein [Mycolicibacterium smegmatis]MBE9650063.1 amino acid-binding protein [Mycolicibacterium smegmatis]
MLAVPSYLLRVQLEDRPGSLGSLAVALGSVGADILSLDVVERGPGYAIDDLVVELPAGSMPDTLITAAENLNGVFVDSIRPHTGLLEAHRELELIDHIAAAPTKADKLQVLASEAPRVLRVGWCTVVRSAGDSAERLAASHGAPETQAATAPWLPLQHAEALDETADWVPQVWRDMATTLAAAPLGDHSTAVVLGRPGGPKFRPSEVARLGYLAGIVATILR